MTYTMDQADTSITDLDELGARIPFGKLPNQTVPASWAASILTNLRDRHPDLFVALMGEAATGYRTEKAARGRKSSANGG